MLEWATVDWSDSPDAVTVDPPMQWKGRVFPARSEADAREAAHAFGYTVLCRRFGESDWKVADT